ncbi:TetR/AcrR family transcriptional regulator [Streptomyces sp. NPDC050529]|uniref:TetR/AcrR family transcriptional regulator n=1 Tax=unclassified Streptomyces TaxID=2593676 RepID=UPI002DD8A1D6|nr:MULTISPECIES: TetR/AcrR family transcriptional regulator [unclassified Streptomyces]MEE4489212.1 TetR/AcrR family transcriptional regulator [Streptomyces sp. BE230]WRZ80131.1 TetR/AcrR family transcriptional regulator [Streptomyces sp. NBC_01022]
MRVGENAQMAGGPADRGRLDKRRAIVEAALRVFAQVGYAQASLDVIAAEAGVSKPTIYNHLGSKENLFRHVMTETAARANAKTLDVLTAFPTDPAELRSGLEDVAHKLVDCYCDEQSEAVRRLLYAEAVRFPDLFDVVRASGPNQFTEALAGRIARLANAGYLRIEDPVRAANQFIALVYEEVPAMSALGTRPLDPVDVSKVVTAGVDTFLRAFGPAPSGAPIAGAGGTGEA